MTIYYRLDTSGDETNLQVYSLHQAAKNWNELIDEIEQVGIDNVSDLKEKLVFILSQGYSIDSTCRFQDRQRVVFHTRIHYILLPVESIE